MASKYASAEWKKAPIRAQIDEALKEVEQVKAALLALKSKAAELDEYHQIRVAYAKQQSGGADRDKAWKPVAKMGEFARTTATGELLRLEGWMKSLIESELALNTLLSPSGSSGAIDYMVSRTSFIKDQADSWVKFRWVSLVLDLYKNSP